MTSDPRFTRRVIRLAAPSVVALAVLWFLEARTVAASPLIGVSLAWGWILMPSILVGSVRRPRLRYAVAIPASLVSVGLIAICLSLPQHPVAAAGWILTTVGTLLGAVLGLWFWFGLLPIPSALADPFSRGRWTLISIHVALIVSGILLIAVSALGN